VASVSLSSCDSVNDRIQVGVLQYCTHDALNLCFDGFKEGMNQGGYDEGKVYFNKLNPEGDDATETSMATNLTTNSSLVVGIATPSALSLMNAIKDADKDLPEVFCSVTDPVSAGLVKSYTEHGNITGTTDAGPTATNIALFEKFNVNKIGILYNMGEPNSVVQFKETQKACADLNIGLVNGGISQSVDIESTLRGMIAQGVKGIFIPVDNTVAAAMSSLKSILIENKIVTVCGDASEIKNGGTLGYATDYYSLGITTGKQAAKILSGTPAKDIPVTHSEIYNLYINDSYLSDAGLTMPENISALDKGLIIHS
jgi:putative ABC transport system substrate-binding protein